MTHWTVLRGLVHIAEAPEQYSHVTRALCGERAYDERTLTHCPDGPLCAPCFAKWAEGTEGRS